MSPVSIANALALIAKTMTTARSNATIFLVFMCLLSFILFSSSLCLRSWKMLRGPHFVRAPHPCEDGRADSFYSTAFRR